jgi:hypothetical protein
LIRYIALEKEKDYPKSIPLKIFAKDIGNCAYVSVSKPVNEIQGPCIRAKTLWMKKETGRLKDCACVL